DPGASATENQNRRDPALPRDVGGGNRFHLSHANGGDGTLRRRRRRAPRHGNAASFSAHSHVLPPARHFDFDRVAPDFHRRFYRLRHLHSLRLAAAPAFPPAL